MDILEGGYGVKLSRSLCMIMIITFHSWSIKNQQQKEKRDMFSIES